MKRMSIFTLLANIAAAIAQHSTTESKALTEKISDVSPDGKFAMRISYDAELNSKMIVANKTPDKDYIHSETIKSIQIVAIPSGAVAADLLKDTAGYYSDITLIWSPDSKWCAFYLRFPQEGYTSVYRLVGDKFEPTKEDYDELKAPVKGNVRFEYIRPIKWQKSGVLTLKQLCVFFGGQLPDLTLQLTAAFDDKSGKFQIVSKKKLPPDVKKD